MTSKYKQVFAHDDLDSGCFLYEAKTDLTCFLCKKVIPANAIFRRSGKFRNGEHPEPSCRECKPFTIFNDKGMPVSKEHEIEWVFDSYEQLTKAM